MGWDGKLQLGTVPVISCQGLHIAFEVHPYPQNKLVSLRCVLCVRLVFLAQPDRHCSHKTMAEVKCHLVTRYGARQRIDVPRAPRDQKSQSVETWPLARGQKSPDAQKGCSVIAL